MNILKNFFTHLTAEKVFQVISGIFSVGLRLFNQGVKAILFIIKNPPRIMNWFFAIGFIVFGLTLIISGTVFKAGTIFFIVGILICPYMTDLLNKKILVNFAFNSKMLVVLFGMVIAIVSLNYEKYEQRLLAGLLIHNAWLDYDNETHLELLKAYFDRESLKNTKNTYFATREKLLAELQLLHQNASYQALVNQGTPYVKFDSQVKQWVDNAKNKLKQEQIEKILQTVPQLIRMGRYGEAYRLANSLDAPELQEQVANSKKAFEKEIDNLRLLYEMGYYQKVIDQGTPSVDLDCRVKRLVNDAKKIEEQKILTILQNLSSDQVEENLTEYTNLVMLFPNQQNYQKKLVYYKNRLAKNRRTSVFITQTEYGDNWPFTVSYGELECLPPGIIIFKANDKTYAVNKLAANSRQYKNLSDIWKETSNQSMTKVDISLIINKGLKLCNL